MNFIVKKIIEWKGTKIMGNILAKIDGFRTYIAIGLGILIGVAGHFWGPITLGPVEVPFVTSKELWAMVWAGVTAFYGRKAISKVQAPPK